VIGRKGVNLIVGWCGRFLFFVVPRQFSQDTGEWLENQILIPDWTYFYCPRHPSRLPRERCSFKWVGFDFFLNLIPRTA